MMENVNYSRNKSKSTDISQQWEFMELILTPKNQAKAWLRQRGMQNRSRFIQISSLNTFNHVVLRAHKCGLKGSFD